MNKRTFNLALVLTISMLISACQTVPISKVQKGFSKMPANENGRVLVSVFRIPKQEDGVKLFMMLGALGGANTNIRYKASIYDVTDDVTYIGTVNSDSRRYGREEWLEYDAPVGKRLLMLTSGGSIFPSKEDGSHVDFIEVDVQTGETNHIAVTQHGFNQRPYLGQIQLSQEHHNFCTSLEKTKPRKLMFQKIMKYMADNNIDEHSKDFARYCQSLTKAARVLVPNAETQKKFVASKPVLSALRKDEFEAWLKEEDKLQPYDLMKSYKPEVIKEEKADGEA